MNTVVSLFKVYKHLPDIFGGVHIFSQLFVLLLKIALRLIYLYVPHTGIHLNNFLCKVLGGSIELWRKFYIQIL